ncbi:MAG TPA: hypothetical protein PLV08_10345 [Flavobacteriales bacterium]|jgi:hypothetical protein|nr:hypothetical protein [Flavobacteriales bacterium]HQY00162.1 hypothetical protein [Flavobacteriales bacterium]
MSAHKGSTRTGLQVLLEVESFVLIGKPESGDADYWKPTFCEMNTAIREPFHSLGQVAGTAHVVVTISALQGTSKYVDMEREFHSKKGRCSLSPHGHNDREAELTSSAHLHDLMG